MYHTVTLYTKPCQILNFIDFTDWKRVVDVMALLGDILRKQPAAAFTLSLIPVIRIFTVHEILEIVFIFGVNR